MQQQALCILICDARAWAWMQAPLSRAAHPQLLPYPWQNLLKLLLLLMMMMMMLW
jgi:hypothetical protein